jgi:hypothetical protein
MGEIPVKKWFASLAAFCRDDCVAFCRLKLIKTYSHLLVRYIANAFVK